MLDTDDLREREVITPDGKGTLIGLDDKDNPGQATVILHIGKAGRVRVYNVEDLGEVEKCTK